MNNIDLSRYHFPFEGDRHLATVICLPYREDTWREKAIPALKEYLQVVKAIASFEPVIVIYSKYVNKEFLDNFKIKNVTLINIEYDDSWARDTLPIFLKDDKDNLLGVDYGFNSWGGTYNGLYSNWDNDNKLGELFLKLFNIPRLPFKDFILEGGSVHTNGKDELITTSCCLLSKGRNPLLSKDQITSNLINSLNLKKVTYLKDGIYNDETTGHVDNIACFLDDKTILIATSDDKNDPQYKMSNKDIEILEKETNYKIIKMVLPKPMYLTKQEEQGIINNNTAIKRLEGRRLGASYVNFYMSDKFIILPKFGVKEDDIAKQTLESFYKGSKQIIQVYSKEILLGGGNIHCITKQIPYSSKYKIGD